MTNTERTADLVLDVNICGAYPYQNYRVRFAPGLDAFAAEWINARRATHATSIANGDPQEDIPALDADAWPLALEAHEPTCEHGMSSQRCMGPDHFMSADQERAWGYA